MLLSTRRRVLRLDRPRARLHHRRRGPRDLHVYSWRCTERQWRQRRGAGAAVAAVQGSGVAVARAVRGWAVAELMLGRIGHGALADTGNIGGE
jgi:hypothetical protein